MGLKEKKDYLLATKEGIRQSIVSHGVALPRGSTFRSYMDKVATLPTAKIDDCSYFFYKGKRMEQFEEINDKVLTHAKNMSYLFYETEFEQYEELPAKLNTQNCEDFTSAFENCHRYCYVPELDLSNCKSLKRAFYGVNWLGHESDFNSIPVWDTSNVEDMSYLFYDCLYALFRRNEGKFPKFNMQNVLDAKYMCYKCWNLITVPELNTAKCKDFSYTFYNCDKLVTVESIDMASCTDATNMFYNCLALESVVLKNTEVLATTTGMFTGCGALKLLVFGSTKVPSFSIANCAFDRDGMVALFDSLPDGGTSTITITGNPCVTDGTLTDSDKAIATSKGYTLTV